MKPYQPDYSILAPRPATLSNGKTVALFPSLATELLKFDIIFHAGSAWQPKRLCAAAANHLCTEGGAAYTAQQVAEYLDFRGATIEHSTDVTSSVLSVYTLRRHAAQVIPFLAEVLSAPHFHAEEFNVYLQEKRQQYLVSLQKTSSVARNLFYEKIFGIDHPHGSHAVLSDFDSLTRGDVSAFYADRCPLASADLQLSGACDDDILAVLNSSPFNVAPLAMPDVQLPPPMAAPLLGVPQRTPVEGSVQSTIRMGRLVPLDRYTLDASCFLVLNVLLGGYFGSRLMSNIREDKGYTYGIYSQTRVMRNGILFFISADVGKASVDDALREVCNELRRLQQEPVSSDELELVRRFMIGDFMRGIDGVFEIAERYRQMQTIDTDERFTRCFFEAIHTVTPAKLQELAQRFLSPDEMLQLVVG